MYILTYGSEVAAVSANVDSLKELVAYSNGDCGIDWAVDPNGKWIGTVVSISEIEDVEDFIIAPVVVLE